MYTVYKHTSPNGKCYIGITSNNPLIRWSNGNGYSGQPYFFRAIMKYGWDNIKHEILFSDLSKEEACQKEIELIKFHKSNNPNYGYNISTGGEGSNSGSKRIGKVFFDKYKVLDYKNKKYTLLCLDCNKIFERTSGCFNKNSIIKCPFEVYRSRPKQFHYITYKNETLTATEWSKKLNVPLSIIIYRDKQKIDLAIGRVNKIKIIVQCAVCGKTFKRKDKQNKYCSKECHYIGLRKK